MKKIKPGMLKKKIDKNKDIEMLLVQSIVTQQTIDQTNKFSSS